MAKTTTKVKYRGIPHKSKTLLQELEEKSKLIWDPKKNLILNRNPRHLAITLIFYGIFYTLLLAFFFTLLSIYVYVVMDANYPMNYGDQTPLQHNPGMAARPQPDLKTSLIRFIQGDPSSYKVHLDHIQTFLEQYENWAQTGENYIDCTHGKRTDQMNKVCRFDIDSLGEKCTWQQEYGYDEGQPCVLLKINKIYGWTPAPYDVAATPPELKGNYNPSYMPVTCEGETPVDKENIGNITFYPKEGFPDYYFPFVNQEDYRQPIVFARFENPMNGVVINVWCKVWAANIYHHRYDMQGSVHFELLVD